jgi:hypothetical protein
VAAHPPAFPTSEEQLREEQRQEALRRERLEAQQQHEAVVELPQPQEAAVEMPTMPPPPPSPRVEEPRIDPKVLLESAGLVMIETDRSKAPTQPMPAEEPQHRGRPRRERPGPAPKDEELVQIETRK